MRTTRAESAELGRTLAQKVNAYRAPSTVLFPMKGLSAIGEPGQPFWDPDADAALLAALKRDLRPEVPLVVLDVPINDPSFAKACAEALLANVRITRECKWQVASTSGQSRGKEPANHS